MTKRVDNYDAAVTPTGEVRVVGDGLTLHPGDVANVYLTAMSPAGGAATIVVSRAGRWRRQWTKVKARARGVPKGQPDLRYRPRPGDGRMGTG